MENIYKNIIELESYIKKQEIDKLSQLLYKPTYFRYFYNTHRDNNILIELLNNNILIDIIHNIDNSNERLVSLRYAYSYFADYAKEFNQSHQSIIKFINSTFETDQFLLLNIMKYGVSIDVQYTIQLNTIIINAIRNQNPGMGYDIGAWISHLLNGSQTDAAFSLLKEMTAVDSKPEKYEKKNKAVPKIEIYWLEEALKNLTNKFVEADQLKIINILSDSLSRALEIEYPDKDDASIFWRAAIEDHPQNYDFKDIKEILLKSLTRALELTANNNFKILKPILNDFLNNKYSTYKRIAIHILRLNKEKYSDIINQVINIKEYLFDASVYHEYNLLLQEIFPTLNDAQKELILSSIYAYESENRERTDGHRYLLLYPLRNSLYGIYKEWFNKENEKREPPKDVLVWHESYSGELSPIEENDLANKTDEEILKELQAFKSEKRFAQPSIGGLARTFANTVSSNPDRFLTENWLNNIAALPYANYSYSMIDALTNIFAKDYKEDKIDIVLDYCSKIITKEYDKVDKDDFITTGSVKINVSRFIESFIKGKQKDFPIKYKGKIWNIVEYLCNYRENHERESLNDPMFGLLNSIRGKAMMLLLDYAIWYAFHTKGSHTEEFPNRLEEMTQNLLEEMLNVDIEKSLDVRAGFGLSVPNIYYLNKKWIEENISSIFPSDPALESYWQAAWIGYMYSSKFYSEIYNKLIPNYRRVINGIKNENFIQNYGHGNKPEEATSEHLVLSCFRNLEDINNKECLLRQYLEIPKNSLVAHTVQFIGELANNSKIFTELPEKDHIWQQAKAFWEIRVNIAEAEQKEFKDLSDDYLSNEFSRYIYWLDDLPEGKLKEIYNLLRSSIRLNKKNWHIPNVIEYLGKESVNAPIEAIELLNELLQTEAQPYFYTFKTSKDINNGVNAPNSIATILENAYNAGERNLTKDIPNIFAERGNYEFKDFWMKHFNK